MQILEGLVQGSQEWLETRAKYFTASEASAAAGKSKHMTRTELLRQKSTGISREIDAATQRLFDQGHAAEDAARQLVEAMIGDELYPCTCVAEVDGLPMLASLDGMTMDGGTIWETKLSNADLRTSVAAGDLDAHYWLQIEQQLLVTGARNCYFTASDGTLENTIGFWYESRPERRSEVIATWKQFAIDLAEYQHVEAAHPVVVAAIDELPALTVELVGSVTATNMTDWKGIVTARIKAISTDLKTDEDFAVAEKTVKFLGDGEKKLEMVKEQALSQTASIDELFRTIDSLSAEMKAKRLNLDKLVKARKESIRMEIMQEAQTKLTEYVTQVNKRIGGNFISIAAADFSSAIKGKKSVSSLRDACDTELARAKIAVSEVADRIDINKKVMEQLCDPAITFPDFAQVCTKATDDFANLIAHRVTQQKDAEEKRLEAERERIRQEEVAKIELDRKAAADACIANEVPAVQQLPTAVQPAATSIDGGARIKLGDINARLHPLSVTADALKSLGFETVGKDGAAKLYRAQDFQLICAAIVRHVQTVSMQPMRIAA